VSIPRSSNFRRSAESVGTSARRPERLLLQGWLSKAAILFPTTSGHKPVGVDPCGRAGWDISCAPLGLSLAFWSGGVPGSRPFRNKIASYGYRLSPLGFDHPIWSPAESLDRSATWRSWTMRAEMQLRFLCYRTPGRTRGHARPHRAPAMERHAARRRRRAAGQGTTRCGALHQGWVRRRLPALPVPARAEGLGIPLCGLGETTLAALVTIRTTNAARPIRLPGFIPPRKPTTGQVVSATPPGRAVSVVPNVAFPTDAGAALRASIRARKARR